MAAPLVIDAAKLGHQELNRRLRAAIAAGETAVTATNVNGQRYIASGFAAKLALRLEGVPGNDLGSFMNGPEITVIGNGQDIIGNTMETGRIVVHGNAGDLIGYAMRGGEILIRGSVGYRVGIHMKAFGTMVPAIVIGGIARDYLGEYLAGGNLVLLNLDREPLTANYIGTGMHGGAIYLRGKVRPHQLGKEVGVVALTAEDKRFIQEKIDGYFAAFPARKRKVALTSFTKLAPVSTRPYGNLYAY